MKTLHKSNIFHSNWVFKKGEKRKMKKVLLILLVLTSILSLSACGNWTQQSGSQLHDSDTSTLNNETETNKNSLHTIGETISDGDFEITVNSAQYISKISQGITVLKQVRTDYWAIDYYDDAIPKEGYTFLKIEITIGYHGKKQKKFNLTKYLKLDYDDGYSFEPTKADDMLNDSDVPVKRVDYYNVVVRFNRKEDTTINISDPLTFTSETKTIYFVVNEEVKNNSDKPLILLVNLSNKIKINLR